jgi:PAS domain S-box-containing protein
MMKNNPVILVVDDQLQNIKLLEGLLVRQGYEIIPAESGEEALEKLSGNQVDLLLLDVKMPRMSGFEVLTKLRADKKTQRIPVVMITAHNEKEARVKALESGCDDFISKPFDQYELLARVKSLLRIKFLNDKADEAHEFAENVINTVREPLISLDQDLRVVTVSRSFYEFFKTKPEETVGQHIYDLGNKQWDIPSLRELLETILPQHTTFENYEVEHNFATIGRRVMLLNARQIERSFGKERIILLAIEDITERKRLEELVIESEERYRRLFETASDGIVLLEKCEGTITHANPATGKMLGYSEEECIGKNLQDIGVSIDTSDFPAIMESLKKSGIINYDDVQVKTKSGQYIDTDIYMVDRASLAQCNIRDVSERKRKEEDIQRLNRTLVAHSNSSKALMSARDESWYLNEVCRIVVEDCGHALVWIGFAEHDEVKTVTPVAHAGFDEGYLASKNFTWSDTERGCGPVGTSIKTGKPSIVRNISGSLIFAPWREEAVKRGYAAMIAIPLLAEEKAFGSLNIYSPYQDPFSEDEVQLLIDLAADLSYGIAAIRQRTARAEAESARQESEIRMRTLVQTIPDLIWLKNEEGKYLACNPMFERLFGAREAEIIGKTDYDFVDKELADFFREKDRKAVAAGKPSSNMEWVTFADDGHRALLDTIKTPMLDAEGKLMGVLGIGRDISEHHKLEEQLRHSQKMEAVGTLAGGIAHDFNNILNVIMGYGSMVIDKLEAGSHLREHMSEVLIAADRAAELTKRLLVFSRKQVVEVKPVNVNGIILGLQKMLSRIIRESIDFNLHLSDTPLIVLADAAQIEQVLINLASNAKDAMQEGGGLTISTELEELDDEFVAANGYGKPGRYALITVADTGHGMDTETRKKIFEPFFTTKGIGEGTGLGLAITYSIIKQHGGLINVYSEPGQGTIFRIYLPLSEEEAAPGKSMEAAIPVRGGNETVLLAEDDASLRQLAVEVLESYGYTVISAENGEDAITKFMENRERISLVMLDMIMPKKNGKEVRDAIRIVSPGIKTLFSSGYTMDIIKTKELMETDFDFIHKPFLPKELLMKVREVLDR